jgi:hypothetical protein
MRKINPDQQAVIFAALQEYAVKQSRIITQYGTDPDAEDLCYNSEQILATIDSIQPVFLGNPDNIYVISEKTKESLEQCYERATSHYVQHQEDASLRMGAIMGSLDLAMNYLK